MKNKKKIILLLALLAVICGLLLWKLWPRPLSRVLDLEGRQIVRIPATAWEDTLEPLSEEGFEVQPMPSIVSIKLDTREAADFLPQMEALLRNFQVRPHWRNLLPGEVNGMEGHGNEEFTVLFLELEDGSVCHVNFLGCRFIQNGRQYRVADVAAMEQLRQIILTNGQREE